ncbi:MAG TPA: GAF domain-containing protein [Anaerolineae bacterium]|nr:GAF domain-containing protein [Anaerolineae bacterium]
MSIKLVIPIVASISYGALLLFVVQHRPRSKAHRVFALYLAVMAVWSLGSVALHAKFPIGSPTFWAIFQGVVGLALPPIAFWFTGAFLVIKRNRGWTYVALGAYVALFIAFLTGHMIQGSSPSGDGSVSFDFGPGVIFAGLYWYFYIGFSVSDLTKRYRQTRDVVYRNRIRYPLIGLSLVSLGTLVNATPLGRYPIDIAVNLINALLIAYAILRHRLLDVSLVIRKGLLYSIPTVIIGASYFLFISLAFRVFQAVARPQLLLFSLAVAIASAIVAQPLRDKAQQWIDRWFFREKYDAGVMLQTVSRAAASELDLDRLTSMILDEVVATMHVVRASILLKRERSGAFRLVASSAQELDTQLELRRDHPILRWYGEHDDALTRRDIDVQPYFRALWKQDKHDLERLGAELFIPLKTKGEIVGVLALGPKRSEETFSQEDESTLTTLANQTAVAIENARLLNAARQEILERRRAEHLARAQRDLAVALSATVDLQHALRLCTRVAIDVSGMDSGGVYLVDPSSGGLDLAFTQGLSTELTESTSHLDPSLPFAQLVTAGNPVFARYEKVGLPVAETRRADRPRSIAILPVRHEGQVIACLNVASHDRDEIASTAQEALQAIAAQLASILSRLRAEKALQESEERYRHVNENIQDVIYAVDAAGRITFISGACEALLGVSAGALIGQDLFRVMIERGAERNQYMEHALERYVQAANEAQEAVQYEFAVRSDGHTRFLEVNERIHYDTEGSQQNAFGVIRDVTERRKAEEEREQLLVAEREHRLLAEALREVTAAVNSSLERQEVLSLALQHLSLLVECDSAVVMLEAGGALEVVARWSTDPDREPRVPPRVAALPHVERVLRERRFVIIPDTADDEGWRQVRGSDYVRCWLGVPLVVREETVGVLALNHGQPGFYTEEHAERAQAVASQAASAIENARLLATAREQAQQVQQIIRTVPEGIILLDANLRIAVVNPAGRAYLEALNGARQGEILTHLGEHTLAELLSPPTVGMWHTMELAAPPSQFFELTAQPVGGEVERSGWVLVLRDVTEERQIEEQVRQQDRLAAIGQLAGGVAHDFNNVLTAIQGYSQLILDALAPDDPQDWPSGPQLRADMGDVVRAAERAARLTRQLLAFSRRQIMQPRILDLNGVIAEFERMLRRLIGEDIELVTLLAPDLGRVEADPGQIEQVIMNLAVNARDAMPNGGRLTVETADVELDGVYAREHVEVAPGSYVMLGVSDTGVGMAEEVKAHAFEPFFTTKEKDKGTGLGLSVVYGIVKQSGGHIAIDSELGTGTTVKVYLPRLKRAVEAAARVQASRLPACGTETILVAEDEEAVLGLACRVLREYGYTVLEAGGPEDALRLAGEHTGRIDLLLTDMVMPGMSGRELAERLLPLRPGMVVLYTSGYTDDAIVRHGVLGSGMPFLHKPFTPVTLAHRVREVLDAAQAPAPSAETGATLDVQDWDAGDKAPKGQAPEHVCEVSLTHESLSGLSADLVAAMREATINADVEQLYELIDRVETCDARVAAALRELAGHYEYDALVGLFDVAGENDERDVRLFVPEEHPHRR